MGVFVCLYHITIYNFLSLSLILFVLKLYNPQVPEDYANTLQSDKVSSGSREWITGHLHLLGDLIRLSQDRRHQYVKFKHKLKKKVYYISLLLLI